jgi:SAM-dependent methyltransferase
MVRFREAQGSVPEHTSTPAAGCDRRAPRTDPTRPWLAALGALGLARRPALGCALAPLLDRFLYRHPFEGASARRYATAEAPGFGDIHARIVDALELAQARRLLDLCCGPGTLAAVARARHPHLHVLAVDPSRTFAARHGFVRAVGEALPFADRSIDVAVCVSSIRHVRDRAQTLRELRRVVRDRLLIVELDPTADRVRIANHADRLGSAILRHAFGPLVVKTAPPAEVIAELAEAAGWTRRALRADPVQPVYVLELA